MSRPGPAPTMVTGTRAKANLLLKIDNFHNDYAQVVESVYTGA